MNADPNPAQDRFIAMLLERDLGEARRERETITGAPGLDGVAPAPPAGRATRSRLATWIRLAILAAIIALLWHRCAS